MKRFFILAIAFVLGGACAEVDEQSEREVTISNNLIRADLSMLRSRPRLVEGKYQRMASNLYDYYRGSMPVFLADSSNGGSILTHTSHGNTGPIRGAMGDPHPENFGLLRGPDSRFALEPNDFDAADQYPLLWDLRRLTVGLSIAVRLSNPSDVEANRLAKEAEESVIHAALQGYLDEATVDDEQQEVGRIDSDRTSSVLVDLFKRAQRDADAHRSLLESTTISHDLRRLRRGILDPTDPTHAYATLPTFVLDELQECIRQYRQTLVNPPNQGYFAIKDAVREFGSGVASWAKVRIIVLAEGPTNSNEDDVLLEIKELSDSGARGWAPPGVTARDLGGRVLSYTRNAWALPNADPLWGTSVLLGLPVQIREENSAFKTVRVARLEQERGTGEEIAKLAAILGKLLARVHERAPSKYPEEWNTHRQWLQSNKTAFIREEALIATAYATVVQQDWLLFKKALRERGPLLGFTPDESDGPPASLRALFGNPPPNEPP